MYHLAFRADLATGALVSETSTSSHPFQDPFNPFLHVLIHDPIPSHVLMDGTGIHSNIFTYDVSGKIIAYHCNPIPPTLPDASKCVAASRDNLYILYGFWGFQRGVASMNEGRDYYLYFADGGEIGEALREIWRWYLTWWHRQWFTSWVDDQNQQRQHLTDVLDKHHLHVNKCVISCVNPFPLSSNTTPETHLFNRSSFLDSPKIGGL